MKLKNILVILLAFIIIFCLTGCEKKDENKELKEKTDASIEYLNDTLISLMNSLNNISFENYYVETEKVKLDSSSSSSSNGGSTENSKSGESSGSGEESSGVESSSKSSSSKESKSSKSINVDTMKPNGILLSDRSQINWEEMKVNIESLYMSWNSIIIDLYKLGISNDDILKFSAFLDNAIVNIKNEDKVKSLSSLNNLFNLLPLFIDSYSDDRTKINIQWVKARILNAYTAVGSNDWNTVKNELNIANQNYSAVMSDTEFINRKSYNTNKVYVGLQELQNSIDLQDAEIFYIKYKNLMQEINLL